MIATKIAGIDEIGVVRKNGTYCRLLLAKGIWRLQEVEVGGRQCHRECPTSPPTIKGAILDGPAPIL